MLITMKAAFFPKLYVPGVTFQRMPYPYFWYNFLFCFQKHEDRLFLVYNYSAWANGDIDQKEVS